MAGNWRIVLDLQKEIGNRDSVEIDHDSSIEREIFLMW